MNRSWRANEIPISGLTLLSILLILTSTHIALITNYHLQSTKRGRGRAAAHVVRPTNQLSLSPLPQNEGLKVLQEVLAGGTFHKVLLSGLLLDMH